MAIRIFEVYHTYGAVSLHDYIIGEVLSTSCNINSTTRIDLNKHYLEDKTVNIQFIL